MEAAPEKKKKVPKVPPASGTSKVNNYKVKPIPKGPKDERPVRGEFICPLAYINMGLVGSTQRGKTTVLWNIITQRITKTTHVYIFCPSVGSDTSYDAIIEWLRKRKHKVEVFQSIRGQDARGRVINHLNNVVHALEAGAAAGAIVEKKNRADIVHEMMENRKPHAKSNVPTHVAPTPIGESDEKNQPVDNLFIFDDLGSTLRDLAVENLLKMARHLKAFTICSFQSLSDLTPNSRRQVRLWAVFGGQPIEKLEELYRDCDTSLGFTKFVDLYRRSTAVEYNFFYMRPAGIDYRINFDQKFDGCKDTDTTDKDAAQTKTKRRSSRAPRAV